MLSWCVTACYEGTRNGENGHGPGLNPPVPLVIFDGVAQSHNDRRFLLATQTNASISVQTLCSSHGVPQIRVPGGHADSGEDKRDSVYNYSRRYRCRYIPYNRIEDMNSCHSSLTQSRSLYGLHDTFIVPTYSVQCLWWGGPNGLCLQCICPLR